MENKPESRDELKNIPEVIWTAAAEHGFERETVTLAVKLDRSRDNTPCDCYVLFDGKELLFLSGINTLRKKEGRPNFSAKTCLLK